MTVLELAWRSVVDWIQIKCLGLTVEYSMPHYIKYINKDQQMHKYQSERRPIKRSILPQQAQSSSFQLRDNEQTETSFRLWKEMKERLERSDEKFNALGHIQRAERFAKMHPLIYEEGIRRLLKEIYLFNKAYEPYKMKLISLLWEATTIKSRLIPAKTVHLVLILKQLLDTLDTTSNRQRRIVNILLLICHQEVIAAPSMLTLKTLAVDLVRHMNLINGKKQGVSPRKYSNPSLKSPGKKSPTKLNETLPTYPKQTSFPTTTKSRERSPNVFKQKDPLFQLDIRVNNFDTIVAVYRGDNAAEVVQRLKMKTRLSVLATHEVKQMIEEFISQHRE